MNSLLELFKRLIKLSDLHKGQVFMNAHAMLPSLSKIPGMRLYELILGIALLLTLSSHLASAQQDVGHIGGTVTDPTGSIVVGARVHIGNIATGIAQDVVSSEGGYYQSQPLAPGSYTVSISSEGFKTFTIQNVIVDAAAHVTSNAQLEIGGVGWETFGALGWNTNAKTVRESVDRYLHDDYPLKWIVIGSGFWPATPETMHETTSFGLWDKEKYSEPRELIHHFLDERLAVMLGLRITFIVGGPYSDEGVRNHLLP
jgi:hypothetical protein